MAVLEEWRPVIGYEDDYEINNLGVVRSLKYGKVRYIKSCKDSQGYIFIGLCKNNKRKFCKVHRIVYESFRGVIPSGMQIDHIDGDKTNNNLTNLRVVTPRENQWNPVTRVRFLEAIKKRTASEQWQQKHHESMKKLSENQVVLNNRREGIRRVCGKPIVQLDKDTNEVIREWPCMADIERELKISHASLSRCCNGKQLSAGGYRWCLVFESCS